jgi:hypothetical protein
MLRGRNSLILPNFLKMFIYFCRHQPLQSLREETINFASGALDCACTGTAKGKQCFLLLLLLHLSLAEMRRAVCLLHVRLPLRRGRIKKFQQDNALDVNSELHAALSLSEQVINALGRQSPVSTAVNELHLFVYTHSGSLTK